MRALIIEQNASIASHLEQALQSKTIDTRTATSATDGIHLAKDPYYNIIVLDLDLIDMDGHSALKELKKVTKTPVIAVSKNNDVFNKVRVLGLGADDYLTKPFASDEFLARLHSIIRRNHGHAQNTVEVGRLSYDFEQKAVYVGGHAISLDPRKRELIEVMALNIDSVVSYDTFQDHIYGHRQRPQLKNVDVHVCKIRSKFACSSEGKEIIHAIIGEGYMLSESDPGLGYVSTLRKGPK